MAGRRKLHRYLLLGCQHQAGEGGAVLALSGKGWWPITAPLSTQMGGAVMQ